MSEVLAPWTFSTSRDNEDLGPRPVLNRDEYDWSSAVEFVFDTPPSLIAEQQEKHDEYLRQTKQSQHYDLEGVAPVVPIIGLNGQPELVAMTLDDFRIDLAKGTLNPDRVNAEKNTISERLAAETPWNAHLLAESEKSLYRVSLTHDFSSREPLTPRGLYNTRNMCFFNSVLQVLIHCAPFNALLTDILRHTPLLRKDMDTPVLNALVKFAHNYAALGGESRRAISGESFYDVICDQAHFHVERDRQEDSQEFLSDLLDVLENNFRQTPPTDEDKKDDLIGMKRQALADAAAADNGWTEIGHKNKAVETQHAGRQDLHNPIEVLFGGRFKSVLTKQGGKPSVTTEPFQQVPLDISSPEVSSVQAAFDEIFVEEKLMLGSTPATKRLELDLLPHILIVSLKRFTFIRHGESFEFGKITKPVTVEEMLRLNCAGQNTLTYVPIGIVYHHGMSATRGHYTADVKVKNQWYSIDDEQVVPIKGSDVVECDVSGKGGSRSAYMVFYEKKTM